MGSMLSGSAAPFVSSCPLQLATGDHPLVAIVEPERAIIVTMPQGAVMAEIMLRGDAEGVDIAWIGQPPRLLVVSRLPDHTEVHLLDVTGAGDGGGVRLCAEKRVEAAMRLVATNASYGLLCGTTSSAVLTRSEDNLAIHPVAARGVPSAAGALGTQIVVGLPGLLEIWDPVARVAKRRLKLPRPAQIRAVGGSDRQIWLTTLSEPNRLEVLPLVNRGQPKAHDLPEPIGTVSGHPKLDVVVCNGADSGRLYVIDLEGRTPVRELAHELFGGRPMAMSLIGARPPAIVAVAAGQAPRLLGLDGTALAEWPSTMLAATRLTTAAEPQLAVEVLAPSERRPAGASTTSAFTRAPTAPGVAPSRAGTAAIPSTPRPGAGSAPSAAGPASAGVMAGTPSAATLAAVGATAAGATAAGATAAGATAAGATAVGATAAGATAAGASATGASATGASRTVFDSKLGQVVADPGQDPSSARATIAGAATILRSARPGTRDDSSTSAPTPASSQAPALAAASSGPATGGPSASAAPPGPRASTIRAQEEIRGPVVPPRSYTAPTPSSPPAPSTPFAPSAPSAPDWRDAAIEAARAAERGEWSAGASRWSASEPSPIEELLRRLELAPDLATAVRGLYGAHLLGRLGLAPATVVVALLGSEVGNPAAGSPDRAREGWSEALAAGTLGRRGLVRLRRGQLRLCGAALRWLDGRPPKFGSILGLSHGTQRARPAVLVIPRPAPTSGEPLDGAALPRHVLESVAQRMGGAVLAVAAPLLTEADLRHAALEAKLRGATAVVPYPWAQPLPTDVPAIFVAPTDAHAALTGFDLLR
jgi:hypothetical protein